MSGFAVDRASPLTSEPQGAVGEAQPVPFWDAVQRNVDERTRVGNDGVREEQWRASLWARHREVEARLGKPMPLSESLSGERSADRDGLEQVLQRLVPADRINAALLGRPGVLSDADYERELDRLRAANPKAFTGLRTRAELEAELDRTWRGISARAAEAGGSGEGLAGMFVGQALGTMADPANLGVAIATGGAGAGRPLVARMLAQGAAGAGTEALAVPGKMEDAAAFGGPRYGAREAAADVGFAAAGAAGFEAAGSAVKAAARPFILRSVGAEAPHLRRAAALAEQAGRDDAAIGAADGAAHEEALAGLERHALPDLTPDRDLSEVGPPATGDRLSQADYRGRTIHGGTFDPKATAVDPVRFQYKADGDAEGVTARLKGVEAWDATASGKVIVWEDRTGARFIADGHQRRALALRMEEKGWDARLDGYLFREADGWSAGDVRTVAALKNIREGSGSALDAAKVLREAPEAIADRSLPVSGEFMAQARGLAQLSEPAFRAAINKVIPERYAAEIGTMAATRPDLHEAMVKLLREAEPANADEARALVVEALQDDWIRAEGDQADLFGYDPSVSAMIARAKIAASVKRSLARDARLFGQLVRNADAIEAGGNALARDANEARLAIDRAALEVTARLALRAGPVGEAMQAAVAKVHAGAVPADAAREVLARVREAIEAGERLDDMRGVSLDPKPPSEAAKALLKGVDEPAFREAQTKEAPEDAELEAGPGLFDDLAADDRHTTARDLLAACIPAE